MNPIASKVPTSLCRVAQSMSVCVTLLEKVESRAYPDETRLAHAALTMIKCTFPSSQRARTSCVYSGFSQSLARQHRRADPRSSTFAHLEKYEDQDHE